MRKVFNNKDNFSIIEIKERTLPHTLMVNKSGKRFCNEATNYSALAGAFHFFDPNQYGYPNLPAWIIFDSNFKDKYSFAINELGKYLGIKNINKR